MRERLFSVEQANAHVPRLTRLIERLQRGALDLQTAREGIATKDRVPPGVVTIERVLAERPALRRVLEGLEAAIDEIGHLGIELKDVELGLIDFPAVLEGEAIYLCWQFGEDRVRFWHGRAEGFAGRRPLPGLPPAPALQ